MREGDRNQGGPKRLFPQGNLGSELAPRWGLMPAGFHIYYQLGRLGRKVCSLGIVVPLSKVADSRW